MQKTSTEIHSQNDQKVHPSTNKEKFKDDSKENRDP